VVAGPGALAQDQAQALGREGVAFATRAGVAGQGLTWPAPLPLAPRPLPDEAVLSWVRRVAARYDLDAPGLVARISPRGLTVHPSRVPALDWTGEVGLDLLLAAATRLDAGRIGVMRGLLGRPGRAGLRHSAFPAWCGACVRDDVARHGEAYERAIWRLGWCVACPVHDCVLNEDCPSCLMRTCHFGHVAGRQRLVCDFCRGPMDALPSSRLGSFWMRPGLGYAGPPRPKPDASVMALQVALLTAIEGTGPAGPLGFGLEADVFLSVVHGLAVPLAWPLASEEAMTAALVRDLRTPGALPVIEVHGLLGNVAAVLGGVASLAQPDPGASFPSGKRATATDLASLLGRFLPWDRALLRRKAPAWGPTLAPIVLGALDAVEDGIRRNAAEAERSRQDAAWARREAAWARDAAKRAAAELRRRRAKRARRAALARLGQTQRAIGRPL
jgi:TniQ